MLFVVVCVSAQQSQNSVSTHSPHGTLNIPCQNCHTFTGWKPIRNVPEFDHNKTKYPLRGMHKKVMCQECHVSPVFTNVGLRCADCHADIHRRQMGAECESCHTVNGWQVSMRSIKEHQNRFPLLGAHAVTDCDSCHKNIAAGQFAGLPTDCVGCHSSNYLNTTAPNHQQAGFPTTCTQCHTSMDTWFSASFDHLKLTGFALTGAHATLECTACHLGGKFQGTPANCIGCHQKDFNSTTNPNHAQAGFPQTCQQCHNTVSWTQVTFDHATFTGFPLTGAHATVPCAQCHVNGNYTLNSAACSTCHMTDYNNTNNPNHKAAGFPTDCSICHSTTSWAGAVFNHNNTPFPLTGAHVNVACASCHVNGQFAGLSTACSSCHLKDFNGTTNPNHAQAGFPQTCEVCHNTTAWQPATFDHSKTAFPLTGAHTTVACANCHVGGNYTSIPTDCYSCHKVDYTGTTNPNHVAAGFPTTCQTCHTTTAWTGATFNHTWFPIPHHTAQLCSDCHTNSSDYSVFVCTSCHTQTQTNPQHQGVSGYVWNSANCYNCHKNGRAG